MVGHRQPAREGQGLSVLLCVLPTAQQRASAEQQECSLREEKKEPISGGEVGRPYLGDRILLPPSHSVDSSVSKPLLGPGVCEGLWHR